MYRVWHLIYVIRITTRQKIGISFCLFFLAAYTADSVGSSTLGIKCRSFTDPEKAFVKYGHKVLELDRLGQFLLLFGISYPNLSRKLGIRQTTQEVSNFFYRVVSETIEKRRKNNIDRSDFLKLLMDLQESNDNGKSACVIVIQSSLIPTFLFVLKEDH